MEALGNYLHLDLDIIKAINKYDYATLSRLNKSDLGDGVKACYLSHYSIFELIVKNGYENALIFEDDVDIELNITDIMIEVHKNLPNDWDLLYLGHCADFHSQYVKTNLTGYELHKSGHPQCSHAYAVSVKGAKKLLKQLDVNNPKDHIDMDILDLILNKEIISYSIFPPIVVQFKGVNDQSDVSPGSVGETYPLMKSTLLFLGYDPNVPDPNIPDLSISDYNTVEPPQSGMHGGRVLYQY
ncbi:glycosyltransferase family 25 protein [Gigaspora margarita]|uniref:Glycosyltransferase family 25 protein n=1 Tax=Gigaspora margarita TaxID=4874 RepID=A0A8H4B4V7_GIGMA|nr:glycosyltransferase family 25 protein [Gigaspora margarita]